MEANIFLGTQASGKKSRGGHQPPISGLGPQTKKYAERPPAPPPCPKKAAVLRGVGNDGQIIFKANAVREPPHRTARADEVPEFPGAVQRG